MSDDKIGEKLDQIQAEQGRMRADMAALRATVETTMKQHAREIEVLFDRLADLDRCVGEIERSYVPRSEHERDEDVNRVAHERFASAISEQGMRGARIAGVIAAVLGVIGLIVWTLERVWRGSNG